MQPLPTEESTWGTSLTPAHTIAARMEQRWWRQCRQRYRRTAFAICAQRLRFDATRCLRSVTHSVCDLTQRDGCDLTQHDGCDLTQHDGCDLTQTRWLRSVTQSVCDSTQRDVCDLPQRDVCDLKQRDRCDLRSTAFANACFRPQHLLLRMTPSASCMF
jgi:hypothetical protein